jgi:prophage regulatory protein
MERIIRTRELIGIIGVSRTTLHRLRKSGGFPAPVQISQKSIGFRESEVRAWMESRTTV